MKLAKCLIIITLSSLFLGNKEANSQVELLGQYRVRTEFLDGYKQPLKIGEKPGFYISHRARLGVGYTHSRFRFNFLAQDVRVWGSNIPLGIPNNGALSIQEVNMDIFFSNRWSLKVGRQPIVYDNGVLFDAINWTMQSLRHDAAIVKYRDSTWSVDVGLAYNQSVASNVFTPYNLSNYKTFQYVWANKKFKNFSASLTFLNNGIEEKYVKDSTDHYRTNFSQTAGTFLSYKLPKWEFSGFGYGQFGRDANHRAIQAYSWGVNIDYKPTSNWVLSLGNEWYSGANQGENPNPNRAFWTMYGGGHAHNGFMDYFYAANHQNDVGLINLYFKGMYKFDKFNFLLVNHVFLAEGKVVSPDSPPIFFPVNYMNPLLGYEMDFRFQYAFIDEITFELGYSFMLGTETLTRVKGGGKSQMSNFAYVMIEAFPFKNLKFDKKKEKKSE